MVRDAGAAEVHMRISCPPTALALPLRDRHADPRGADRRRATTSRRSAASSGADSLAYLSLEGMLASVSGPPESYCTACWTGDYRVPLASQDKLQAELFPIRAEEQD